VIEYFPHECGGEARYLCDDNEHAYCRLCHQYFRRKRDGQTAEKLLIEGLELRIRTELMQRVRHAETKHPEGPSIEALIEEVGEVQEAHRKGCNDSYRYELLDVMTVAFRLYREELYATKH
jgi:hypothetical protein